MNNFWQPRITVLRVLLRLHLITFFCFFLGLLAIQPDAAQAACNPQFKQVNVNGFGSPANSYCWSMKVFNGHLYVGTRNPQEGGEIWRYDGTNWEKVVSGGLISKANGGFRNLEVFNSAIYAGTKNSYSGAQLLRSLDGTDWKVVMANGFGVAENESVRGLQTFDGHLYIGLQNTADGPGQLYRTSNGTDFTPVSLDGFGDPDNSSMHTMAVFNGDLYVATRQRIPGLRILRSSDGLNFEMVVGPGAATPEGFSIQY